MWYESGDLCLLILGIIGMICATVYICIDTYTRNKYGKK